MEDLKVRVEEALKVIKDLSQLKVIKGLSKVIKGLHRLQVLQRLQGPQRLRGQYRVSGDTKSAPGPSRSFQGSSKGPYRSCEALFFQDIWTLKPQCPNENRKKILEPRHGHGNGDHYEPSYLYSSYFHGFMNYHIVKVHLCIDL